MMHVACLAAGVWVGLLGLGAQPSGAGGAGEVGLAARWAEVAPGVRVDVGGGVVEFDGEIAIEADRPAGAGAGGGAGGGRLVYLEQVVCTRDTREHESIVVTDAVPSAIHAALLAAGLEPGSPGGVVWEGGAARRVGATGDGVRVTIRVTDETGAVVREAGAWEWVARAQGLGTRGERVWREGRAMVFAGSRPARHPGPSGYDADGAGTVIGLASFGSEVIAPAGAISPEASIDEPEWVARPGALPARGTPVTVVIEAARGLASGTGSR